MFGQTGGASLNDPLLEEAKDMIIKTGKASASYLQRMFRIGYARAASLLDMLEMQGVVGPADGSKAREVIGVRSKNQFTEDEEEELEESEEPLSDLDASVKKNIEPEKKEEIKEEIEDEAEQAKIEEENTEEEEEDEF